MLPEYQGRGVGKRFYERFFEIALAENVKTMRMYTGTKNVVSKGLAEHFGFELAETFRSATLDCATLDSPTLDSPTELEGTHTRFQLVTDPAMITKLLLDHGADWNGYFVMNRTFYQLSLHCVRHLLRLAKFTQAWMAGTWLLRAHALCPKPLCILATFLVAQRPVLTSQLS